MLKLIGWLPGVAKLGGAAFGLKGMAIALAIGALAGGASSWWLRDTICDAAEAKAEAASLKAEKARLEHQLEVQRMVAITAAAERDQLNQHKTDLDQKVADYVEELRNAKTTPAAGCTIDAGDLQFRDRLRQQRRPRS